MRRTRRQRSPGPPRRVAGAANPSLRRGCLARSWRQRSSSRTPPAHSRTPSNRSADSCRRTDHRCNHRSYGPASRVLGEGRTRTLVGSASCPRAQARPRWAQAAHASPAPAPPSPQLERPPDSDRIELSPDLRPVALGEARDIERIPPEFLVPASRRTRELDGDETRIEPGRGNQRVHARRAKPQRGAGDIEPRAGEREHLSDAVCRESKAQLRSPAQLEVGLVHARAAERVNPQPGCTVQRAHGPAQRSIERITMVSRHALTENREAQVYRRHARPPGDLAATLIL